MLFAGTAHAWSHRTTDQAVSPQLVRGKLVGPVAELTARFVIPLEKGQYSQALSGIELPPLGMVTGATATLNGATHPLALVTSEEADTKFNALAVDEERPGERASAVMISGDAGSVTVGIAAGHGGVLTLELSVSVPTCYFRDARYVSVPEGWRTSAEIALRKPIANEDDVSQACVTRTSTSRGSTADAWLQFAAPELTRRRSGERLGAFGSRVALGDEHVARIELDLSTTLSDVPRDLATVILVDSSRSLFPEEIEAQRQLVGSYLRAAPDSRVQVIAYARHTKPLLPGWTTASQAAPRVDRELRALAPRNGSNFDAALAEAASWLDRVEGTRRIVLVTDERMAERLELTPPVTLRRLLAPGTLVHVVTLGGGEQHPVRDEEAKLAPLAASTDGMAVRTGALKDPKELDATLLVRPISLDFVKIKAPGWTQITPASGVACGDEEEHLLPEGESCTWWGEGDASSGVVVVEGLLWGKRTQRFVQPDPAHARDVARELSAFGALDDRLQERVNVYARAVNAKWSLYAQWGGKEGFASGFGYGLTGIGGTCDCGGIGTIGHGTGTGGYYEPPDLAKQLRPLLAACKVEAVHVNAKLEMTLTEIAELTVTMSFPSNTPSATQRKQQQCVEDALWDSTPMLTHVQERHTYDVDMPALR